MNERTVQLFKDFYLLPGTKYPILVGKLPEKILEEVLSFIPICDQFKNHSLSFLRELDNGGNNNYQVTIPAHVLESSFFMAFLNCLGEVYVSKVHNIPLKQVQRRIGVKRNISYFGNYHVWLNYAYKNSYNKLHDHANATLSGVVYLKNTDNEPTVFTDNIKFTGSVGDIIIFPSEYKHYVDIKQTDNERITLAFNLQEILD